MFEELMTEISEKAVLVDKMINQVMPEGEDLKVLYEASSHLIKAGGKRIRPFLVLKSDRRI
jgi:geranylgeranyl diphosphate synthase type I